jgi:hypothetical protein
MLGFSSIAAAPLSSLINLIGNPDFIRTITGWSDWNTSNNYQQVISHTFALDTDPTIGTDLVVSVADGSVFIVQGIAGGMPYWGDNSCVVETFGGMSIIV